MYNEQKASIAIIPTCRNCLQLFEETSHNRVLSCALVFISDAFERDFISYLRSCRHRDTICAWHVPGHDDSDSSRIRSVIKPRLFTQARRHVLTLPTMFEPLTAWSYFALDLRKWNPAVSLCSCKWRANNIPCKTSRMVYMDRDFMWNQNKRNEMISSNLYPLLIFNLLCFCKNLFIYLNRKLIVLQTR